MSLTERKNTLLTQIQGSIFLENKLRKALLHALDFADEKIIGELERLFLDAEKEQNSLINKAVQCDDTFLPRLKKFKRSKLRVYQKQAEKSEREEEKPEDILKKI